MPDEEQAEVPAQETEDEAKRLARLAEMTPPPHTWPVTDEEKDQDAADEVPTP